MTQVTRIKSPEKIGINEALKRFGGFVRYYDSTEPLTKLAALVSADDKNILACCAGGDQALTILGAGRSRNVLWAVDVNPAQLFILAAKAFFLKQNNSMPSFGQLQKLYPGKIAAVKKNICRLKERLLYHTVTGKAIAPPDVLVKRYSLILDDGMFVLPESGPFWRKDLSFITRVRAGIDNVRFANIDVFDSPDHFKQGSLDIIYLSDIFWQENLVFYQAKLARLAGLLRLGGRIISHIDAGHDFRGQGISPGLMLAQQARKLGLKIGAYEANGYLVLERMRKK